MKSAPERSVLHSEMNLCDSHTDFFLRCSCSMKVICESIDLPDAQLKMLTFSQGVQGGLISAMPRARSMMASFLEENL